MIYEQLSEHLDTMVENLAFVLACIICALLLAWVVYIFIAQCLTDKMRNDYVKNLNNDHDKSIIAEYNSTRYSIFRKKNKKNDTSKN